MKTNKLLFKSINMVLYTSYILLVVFVLICTAILMFISLCLISQNVFLGEHLYELLLLGFAMWIFIIFHVFTE
jgi:hypothetical protein